MKKLRLRGKGHEFILGFVEFQMFETLGWNVQQAVEMWLGLEMLIQEAFV